MQQTEALDLVVEVINGKRVTERHVLAAEAIYEWIADLYTSPQQEKVTSRKAPKVPTREEVRNAVVEHDSAGPFTRNAIARDIDAPYADLRSHFDWMEKKGIIEKLDRRERGGGDLYVYVPPIGRAHNRQTERTGKPARDVAPVAGTGRAGTVGRRLTKGAKKQVEMAKDAGLSVKTGSKHMKIVNKRGELVAVLGTPSDARSDANSVAALKREARNG